MVPIPGTTGIPSRLRVYLKFTSTDVDDSCLDGAFVALFLPEGAGTQSDWQYPIELPAWSALPATLDVQLQEPFSTTEVTMTAGDTNGTITIAGVPQTDVEYDSANSYWLLGEYVCETGSRHR